MEDEASVPLDGKGLGNLRVVDLKQELEKRGLSKSGSKKDLVKRLKQQLEFEKLCEGRKASGESDHKLELDAATEQNEFVQQYLAQQQKRMEEKRLAQEANQKLNEEKFKEIGGEQISTDENTISESDETGDSSRSRVECNQDENLIKQDKDISDINTSLLVIKVNKIDEKCSSSSETEDEETKSPTSADILENLNQQQKGLISPANVSENENNEQFNNSCGISKNISQQQNVSSSNVYEFENLSNLQQSTSIEVLENAGGKCDISSNLENVSENINHEQDRYESHVISENLSEVNTPNVLESVCVQEESHNNPVDVSVDINEEKEGPRTPVNTLECVNDELKGPRTPIDISENVNEDEGNPEIYSNTLKHINKELKDQSNFDCNTDNVNIDISTQVISSNDQIKDNLAVINSAKDTETECIDLSLSANNPDMEDSKSKFSADQCHILQNKEELKVSSPNSIEDKNTKLSLENICHSQSESLIVKSESETLASNIIDSTETERISTDSRNTKCIEPQTSDDFERIEKISSSLDIPQDEKSSFEHSCRQDSMSNMESSHCSSVPYSLSDIQLPGSPGNHHSKSNKSEKIEESSHTADSDDNEITKDNFQEENIKANGVSVGDDKSQNETSDLESKRSVDSADKNQKSEQKSHENKSSDKSEKITTDIAKKIGESEKKSSRSRHFDRSISPEKVKRSERKSKRYDRSVSPEKSHKVEKKCKSRRSDRSQSTEKVHKLEKKSKNKHFDRNISPEQMENVEKKSKSKHYDRSISPERVRSVERKHKSRQSDRSISPERKKVSPDKIEFPERISRSKWSDRSISPEIKRESSEKQIKKFIKSKWSDGSDSSEKDIKSDKKYKSEKSNKSVSSGIKHDSAENMQLKTKSSKNKWSDRSVSPESKQDLLEKVQDHEKEPVKIKKFGSNSPEKILKLDQTDESRSSDRNISPKPERKSKSRWSDKMHSPEKVMKDENVSSGSHHFSRSLSPEKKTNNSRQSTKSKNSDEEFDKDKNRSEKYAPKFIDPSLKHDIEELSKDSLDDRQKLTESLSVDSSSDKMSDSEHEQIRVDSKQKDLSGEQISVEPQTIDSRNDKSSDSEQEITKHRRKRQDSSSSHSSDNSSKRRRSKKSLSVPKSKDYVEKNKKYTVEKIHENTEKSAESSSASDVAPKQRLKIKRDNVQIEAPISNQESSSKNIGRPMTTSSTSEADNSYKSEHAESKTPEPHEISYVPRKVSLSNRKLNRSSSDDASIEPKQKKSKWGSFATPRKTSQTISISTDSLKNWFPDFKLISEPTTPMELESEEHSLPTIEEKLPNYTQTETFDGSDSGIRQASTSQIEVDIVEPQEPDTVEFSEQGPTSKIIFIQNLVRPFTLNQLKDLLKQSGNIVEEFFWIDKIKSKCFVMYETEKEAAKARNALNNTRWPSSNPKILSVEFSNEEELDMHKKGTEHPPKPAQEPVADLPEIADMREPLADENRKKERDRRRERDRSKPQQPIREWDKDKIVQESPDRELVPKEEKSRNVEKKEKKDSKKRPNEDTSAKLLDDLFQKTKSTPCIYWLPLTEEQAKQKEEAKKLRKLEREKRNQQMREQETERRNRRARSNRRSREKDTRKSSTRSRSPVTRRR